MDFTILPQRQGVNCFDASSRRGQERHRTVGSFLDDRKGGEGCTHVGTNIQMPESHKSQKTWGKWRRVHGEKAVCVTNQHEKQLLIGQHNVRYKCIERMNVGRQDPQ